MSHDEKADTFKGNLAHYVGNLLQDLSTWPRSIYNDIHAKEQFRSHVNVYLENLVKLTENRSEAYEATLELQKLLDDYINSPNEDKWAKLKSTADKIK